MRAEPSARRRKVANAKAADEAEGTAELVTGRAPVVEPPEPGEGGDSG